MSEIRTRIQYRRLETLVIFDDIVIVIHELDRILCAMQKGSCYDSTKGIRGIRL